MVGRDEYVGAKEIAEELIGTPGVGVGGPGGDATAEAVQVILRMRQAEPAPPVGPPLLNGGAGGEANATATTSTADAAGNGSATAMATGGAGGPSTGGGSQGGRALSQATVSNVPNATVSATSNWREWNGTAGRPFAGALSRDSVGIANVTANARGGDGGAVGGNANAQANATNGGSAFAQATGGNSEQANLRLRVLEKYKRIVAPFDGLVTARTTDVGALINASAGGAPLFVVSDVSKLRVYVNVPQNYLPGITLGPRVSGNHDDLSGHTNTSGPAMILAVIEDGPRRSGEVDRAECIPGVDIPGTLEGCGVIRGDGVARIRIWIIIHPRHCISAFHLLCLRRKGVVGGNADVVVGHIPISLSRAGYVSRLPKYFVKIVPSSTACPGCVSFEEREWSMSRST